MGIGPLMAIKMKTQMQPFALAVSKALVFHKVGRRVKVKTVKYMSHFLNRSVSIPKWQFPALEKWVRLTCVWSSCCPSHCCGKGATSTTGAKIEKEGDRVNVRVGSWLGPPGLILAWMGVAGSSEVPQLAQWWLGPWKGWTGFVNFCGELTRIVSDKAVDGGGRQRHGHLKQTEL